MKPGSLGLVILALCLALAAPAAAAPGDLLVADSRFTFEPPFAGGAVIRVAPATGTRTLVSDNATPPGIPGFGSPAGIALEADGQILVTDASVFGAQLLRVDPVSGTRTLVSDNANPPGGPSFATPGGIAVETDGGILVADRDAVPGGAVIRVDPVTGARTTVSANESPAGGPLFLAPTGVVVEADGDILVVDLYALGGGGQPGGAVIRVDPVTGARTVVSSNTSPPGGPGFTEPFVIALEAGGQILVASPTTSSVLRVDPSTGVRTTVSQTGAPPGEPSVGRPSGIAVEADGAIVLAVANAFEGGGRGLVRIDPVTGVRTTVTENADPPGEPSFVGPAGVVVEPLGNAPPDCSAVAARPAVIPAARHHDFTTVRLVGATDPDGDTLAFHIDGVTQDERVFGGWFGGWTAPDARLTAAGADSRKVRLRAERDNKGDGRVYRIGFTVSDGTDSCSGVAKVSVPRHRWRPAIDSAPPSFDSFTGAPLR